MAEPSNSARSSEPISPLVEHLFRRQAGRIISHLARLLGPARLTLAEECVQEAMLRALATWPYSGIPAKPEAWLYRVARNAAVDALRRRDRFPIEDVNPSAAPSSEPMVPDEELAMILMCCHPEIPAEARVALSLKTVGGLSVREIARAFQADDATIAQRLVRAKRLIRLRGLTLDLPRGQELESRLDSVLSVIYCMFNEGYSAAQGEDLVRSDLCVEALRLGELLCTTDTAPTLRQPRVFALTALMALKAARADARLDSAGELVLLEDQDPAQWDQRLVALGFHYFDQSITGDAVSRYHVEAAIAAHHAKSILTRQPLDWPQILSLYDELIAITGPASPVAQLNRVVAFSRVHGAPAGLAALDNLKLDDRLPEYHLLLAARGHLLLESGNPVEASDAFRRAIACRCSQPERRFLERKLAQCASASSF